MKHVLSFCLCLSVLSVCASETPKPLTIGSRKQLFVDDYIVVRKQHVRRVLHPAQKENGGKPIFTEGRFYGTVLHHSEKFKMWWRTPGRQGFGYAESTDGLHFKKVADVQNFPYESFGGHMLGVDNST